MRTLKYLSNKEDLKMKTNDCEAIPDEITLEYFSSLVKSMRHQQRRYYATRSKSVLAESTRLEKKVDDVLNKIYNKQMNLF